MITFETIADSDGFAALRQTWERLAAAAPTAHVFQGFDWPWQAWTCINAQTSRLHIVVGRVGGEIVLIWPLGFERRALRFISSGMTEYHDVLVAEGPDTPAWLDAALGELRRTRGADYFFFFDIPVDSRLADLLERDGATGTNRKLVQSGYRSERKGWRVRLTQDWDGYFATRARRFRSDQRRQWRRAAELPDPVMFRVIQDADHLARCIDWLFDRKLVWLTERGITIGQFASDSYGRFARAVVMDAHRSGTLIAGELHAGEATLSVGYGIVFGDEFMFYQFAYDPAFQSLSPSRLLMECLIRQCFDRGLLLFDMLPGVMPFKGIWANERPVVGDHLIPITLLGRVKLGLLTGVVGRLAKTPWLLRRYRRLPRRLRDLVRWRWLADIDYSADLQPTRAGAHSSGGRMS